MKLVQVLILTAGLMTIASCLAENKAPYVHIEQALKITDKAKRQVIRDYKNTLLNEYVFEEKAKQIALQLDGLDLTGIHTRIALTDAVNKVLHSYDHHLSLVSRVDAKGRPEASAKEPWFRKLARKNSGIRQAEILAGNIGYLDMWGFDKLTARSREVIAASMKLLANTDGLILDFRDNGGGDSFMLSHFSQYFLPSGTKLHTYQFRGRRDYDFVTREVLGSNKFRKMPVYILTSKDTFSAGESFAYLMKHLKRARVVGEVTKGGANPVSTYAISHNFEAWVSVGTTINAVTGSNWEQKGVQPDVKLTRDIAFGYAYGELLEYQKLRVKDAFFLADIEAQLAKLAASSNVKTP